MAQMGRDYGHGGRHPIHSSSKISIHLIDTLDKCKNVIHELSRYNYVGFDCEGYPQLSRNSQIGLIQLATFTDSYLFDIVAFEDRIPMDLKGFLENEKGPLKVIHDSRADGDALKNRYGIQIRGILDTTVANLVEGILVDGYRPRVLQGQKKVAKRILDSRIYSHIPVCYVDAYRCSKQKKQSSLSSSSSSSGLDFSGIGSFKKKRVMAIEFVDLLATKEPIKKKMNDDPAFWSKRPLTNEMAIYAGMDAYMSVLVTPHYQKRLDGIQMDIVIHVSSIWSRLISDERVYIRGSALIPSSIKSTIVQLNGEKRRKERWLALIPPNGMGGPGNNYPTYRVNHHRPARFGSISMSHSSSSSSSSSSSHYPHFQSPSYPRHPAHSLGRPPSSSSSSSNQPRYPVSPPRHSYHPRMNNPFQSNPIHSTSSSSSSSNGPTLVQTVHHHHPRVPRFETDDDEERLSHLFSNNLHLKQSFH